MLKTLLLSLSLLLAPLALAEETHTPNPLVVIKTSEGDITLRLFADKSPIAVQNFLTYVDEDHYDGTIFHRVIPDFMIQAGLTAELARKETRDPIVNEAKKNKLHNTRGTVAMARLDAPDSATDQFFINLRNNLSLDWTPGRAGYTVFGEVIQGMRVVDFIATAPTGKVAGRANVPLQPIVIKEIVRQ